MAGGTAAQRGSSWRGSMQTSPACRDDSRRWRRPTSDACQDGRRGAARRSSRRPSPCPLRLRTISAARPVALRGHLPRGSAAAGRRLVRRTGARFALRAASDPARCSCGCPSSADDCRRPRQRRSGAAIANLVVEPVGIARLEIAVDRVAIDLALVEIELGAVDLREIELAPSIFDRSTLLRSNLPMLMSPMLMSPRSQSMSTSTSPPQNRSPSQSMAPPRWPP